MTDKPVIKTDKPVIKDKSHCLSKQNGDNLLNTQTVDSQMSSADNVDRHLQTLEANTDHFNQRQRSPEEQLFTEEELARLINPDKLQSLMESGDDLVNYLTSEIDKFEK